MILKNITLTNFRNYHHETVSFGSGIHFIIGANGEGKTNLLESIYFLSLAKSYKSNDQILIQHGEDLARIEASVIYDERRYEMKMILTPLGKKILVNKIEQKRLSDYIGKLRIISFLPEDMNLIKGSPRERRYFMDIYLGQMDKTYITELSEYKHILKQRNELLKSASSLDPVLFEILTDQLVEKMKPIIEKRKMFVASINELLNENYHRLSSKKESYEIVYKPSLDGENMLTTMKSKIRTDQLSKTTTFGIHRDDYEFILNKKMASDYASNGEQRVLILSLDMALFILMKAKSNDIPIVLLDDVFSELDQDKQNKLITYLHDMKAQTLITSTSLHEINPKLLEGAKIYRVNHGTITEEEAHGN